MKAEHNILAGEIENYIDSLDGKPAPDPDQVAEELTGHVKDWAERYQLCGDSN